MKIKFMYHQISDINQLYTNQENNELSELFGVNVGELLDIPLSAEGDQLSEEEIALLTLYRRSHVLPKKMRRALTETLESTINMYIAAGESRKKR